MKIACEVDTLKDTNLYFPAIGKRIRGKFDPQRRVARNPDNAPLLGQWPRPVPGQLIELDTEKAEVTVREPLEDEENSDIVDLFKKRGIKIPETETHRGVHVPSCLHILKNAVDAGLCKVVEGKIPSKIEGRMLKSFINPGETDPEEELRQTVAENSRVMRQCALAIEKLAEAISNDWDKD